MKLNLGCGRDIRSDYVNVDRYHPQADLNCDLEQFPWVWASDSVSEILLIHVLEHLGRDPDVFIGIMKEIYRVCEKDAQVHIMVPHPRHDNFIDDPTHVRPITLGVLSLFSKANCEMWDKNGSSNSQLAKYHGVDFEITDYQIVPDPRVVPLMKGKAPEQLHEMVAQLNNIAQELRFTLKVKK